MISIYFLWLSCLTFIDRKGIENNTNQNWTIERVGKNIIILAGGLLVWHGVPNNRMAEVPGSFLFCNE